MTRKKTYNKIIFSSQTITEAINILKKNSSFWHGGSWFVMSLESNNEEQTYDDVDAFFVDYGKGFDNAYISLEYVSHLSFISFHILTKDTYVTVSHTNQKVIQEIFHFLDTTGTVIESNKPIVNNPLKYNPDFDWDAFICHASEDKDIFVRQLATELQKNKLKIWYDEFTLTVGDSLRMSIENGLAKSRYGIVVLSKNFFAKRWPQDELNGLAAKERNTEKVILPVLLDVDDKYICKFAPILADRLAAKCSDGMAKVVTELMKAMK
jgi:hypothetical protein